MRRESVVGLLFFAAIAQAGNLQPLSVDTLATAPAIVVCRVDKITQGGDVPAQEAPWAGTRYCTAELRVLRATPEFKTTKLRLGYYCAGPRSHGVNGHPMFPALEAGNVSVLPLKPKADQWRLIADEGWGIVVPAVAAEPKGKKPASPREFIIREMVNTLLGGTYNDLYRFSLYMQIRSARELNDELMASLKTALPQDDPRWLGIATASLAIVGIPRQKLDELIAGQKRPDFGDATRLLAASCLREVAETHRRQGIVRNMLRYTPIHEWGSAATLVPEFKDDPLMLKLLREDLQRDRKGTVYVAWWLASNGQTALLDVSLSAALKALRNKGVDYPEINAACKLLLVYGSEGQFSAYLESLKESEVHDSERYGQLWQVAWEGKSPRVVRILAVLLDDERRSSLWDDVRYCDFAGALLERVSGEKFGFTQWDKMPLAERNEAVARARDWIKRAPNNVTQ